MKLAAAGLILVSSTLVTGCAVYPDGTPAYSSGGYSAYPAYPGGYEPGYYGAPVVQSGVVVGGGYYGGPGPRYWDDGPGYRRPPPGGWGDRGDRGGNRGGDRGGDRGDRGGHGGPQQAGGGPQGGGPQGGRPPQAGGPGASPPPQQQQARTPYVGRSNWNKPSPVQGPQGSDRNH